MQSATFAGADLGWSDGDQVLESVRKIAAEDLSLMQKFQIAARRVGLSLPPGQTFVASVQQAMAETGLESSGGNLTRDVELLYNTFKL